MNEQLKQDIDTLLAYLLDTEETHYEENPSEHHIFVAMQRIKDAVGE